MKEGFLSKFVGDRKFYARVIAIVVPIIIQNFITNFVGLLDNLMIGRVGTEPMTGVAIVNQLMFVFNIGIFGAISGAGIFTAQFFGRGDHEGVRNTFRFKMFASLLLVLLGCVVFIFGGDALISMYLNGETSGISKEATLQYGKDYLGVMVWGLLPFAVEQYYSSTIRECGETTVPMIAGIVAVFLNLGLNCLLIFGLCGFPALGAVGAAIATVISRYVQVIIVLIWAHTHGSKLPFIVGLYKSFKIPGSLTVQILIKGTPLMCNELLWACGMAIMNQCYSMRGMDVVAASNISSTISNLFNVVLIAMGNAVAIMVGQLLGAGKLEEAVDTDRKLIAFSMASCLVMGTGLVLVSPLFPAFYDTTAEVKALATSLIRISAAFMPLFSFLHAAYFTLRSGGKTIVTFLFDSVFMWCVSIPVAFCLSRFTGLPIIPMYLACQALDLIKCVIGFILLVKKVWVHKLEVQED